MEYTNRRGERYYLLQCKTKTGKPKYYVSRKPEGTPVEAMPEGYEFYEHPERGLVSVRKVRASRVLPLERELLAKVVQQAGVECCLIDVQEDSLVVWTTDTQPKEAASFLGRFFAPLPGSLAQEADWIAKHSHYSAMLRFRLTDEKQRLFSADRWCFRGRINGWIRLGSQGPLKELAEKFVPHVNQESFFDLM